MSCSCVPVKGGFQRKERSPFSWSELLLGLKKILNGNSVNLIYTFGFPLRHMRLLQMIRNRILSSAGLKLSNVQSHEEGRKGWREGGREEEGKYGSAHKLAYCFNVFILKINVTVPVMRLTSPIFSRGRLTNG